MIITKFEEKPFTDLSNVNFSIGLFFVGMCLQFIGRYLSGCCIINKIIFPLPEHIQAEIFKTRYEFRNLKKMILFIQQVAEAALLSTKKNVIHQVYLTNGRSRRPDKASV